MKPSDVKRLKKLLDKYPKLFATSNNASTEERPTDEFYINGDTRLPLATTREADFTDMVVLSHLYAKEDLT